MVAASRHDPFLNVTLEPHEFSCGEFAGSRKQFLIEQAVYGAARKAGFHCHFGQGEKYSHLEYLFLMNAVAKGFCGCAIC
jgi:hypothetical protein